MMLVKVIVGEHRFAPPSVVGRLTTASLLTLLPAAGCWFRSRFSLFMSHLIGIELSTYMATTPQPKQQQQQQQRTMRALFLSLFVAITSSVNNNVVLSFTSPTVPTSSSFGVVRRLRHSSSALSMTVEETDLKGEVKVGVIGMGRIGLVHLEAITKAPGVTPVIVSNPTVSKAEAGR